MYPSRYANGVVGISAPNSSGQPICGTVRDPQGLLFVGVFDDGKNGSKNLLLSDRCVRAYAVKDGGPDKKPPNQMIRAFHPAEDQPGPFAFALFYKVANTLALSIAH